MKTLATALVVLVALAALAMPAAARVLVFDMGTANSPVWPGARKVTASDPGWSSTRGLVEHDAPAQGSPIWTNTLNEDSVMGTEANAFRFPAAKGRWHVYVLAGFGARWDRGSAQHWDFDVTVGAETRRYQLEAPDWIGPIRFEHHVFTTVSTGEIEVRLAPHSRWTLSGLIAWQPGDYKAARELIARVEQWAPVAEMAKWKEDTRPPAGPEPSVDAADRERGFLIWHRHWATPIYPWTNPTPDEINPTLRIFASPGEYEPLTFTVRLLRAVDRAEVEVEAIGPVPAGAVEVRKVRYLKARRNYSDSGLYRTVPDILDRWQPGPLTAGENATFWLTVHIPDDAPPGIYHSRIGFTADGKSAEIPVVLRVLDAKLLDDPGHTYGIYYDDPVLRSLDAPDEVSRRYWVHKSEMEHADMVAHGTRNIELGCWSGAADATGKFDGIEESFQRLDTQLKMAERFAFEPPYMVSISTESIYEKYMKESLQSHLKGVKMPPEAFFTELAALVRTIEAERMRRGWPEFIYQPFDEPSADPDIVAFMTRVYGTVKSAGVRTYTTAAPEKPGYQPFKPFVDVWCTQTFLPEHDEAIADMKANPGREYWCYPNDISGENDHTPVAGARMTYGFGFWRSGFRRLIPWMYQHNGGDPFNYLDDGMMDFLVRSEPDGTPIPVALWEAYREGYDDMRYLHSLQQAIARAEGSPSEEVRQEAAAAQQTLDSVWNGVPVRPQYQYGGFWSPDEMDVYRWMVAERLERLTKLLR